MALQPFVGPWPLFTVSWSYTQSAGLLGRGISPSQRLYLYTEQQKHKINTQNTDIQAFTGIRTHDLSVRAGEDSSCLRPRGHPHQCWQKMEVHLLYEPGYAIPWVGNLTEQKVLCKCLWISHGASIEDVGWKRNQTTF
jgi:hypothetical protein